MKSFKLLFAILIIAGLNNSRAQGIWTQKAVFGGGFRGGAVGFSIADKGYLGTGADASSWKKDFWEYDPATNTWTQKADFGGTIRHYAVSFSIGNKGYLGTGFDGSAWKKDFWEYDPATNTWTRKADFGGSARGYAAGFSIADKGYIGTGKGNIGTGDDSSPWKKDFWEYDPATNTWTQKTDFEGGGRRNAVGFSIADKGYIGTGADVSSYKRDLWEYDPATNTWTQKADFGGTARSSTVGFSIADKGYLGTGWNGSSYYKDFWAYDPATNTWTQKADFGGTARGGAAGFSIADKGYLGTGGDGSSYKRDFWEYTPEVITSCLSPTNGTTTNITGNSSKLNWDETPSALGYVVKYNTDGGNEKAKVTYSKTNSKPISGLAPNTTYFWRVKSVCSEEPKVVSGWSEKQYFTTDPLKVSNQLATTMELYPNPVADHFTLNLQLPTLSNQAADIFLLNTLGQVFYSTHAIAGNGTLNQVIAMPATAASGWYVVRVVLSDEVIEQKLLYQK